MYRKESLNYAVMPLVELAAGFLKQRLPHSLWVRLTATRAALLGREAFSEETRNRINALNAEVAAARREIKRQRSRASRRERQVLTPVALEILLPSRHEALRRSVRTQDAAIRESAFAIRAPSYSAAKAAPVSAQMTAVDSHGLTFWVPAEPAGRGGEASLARRLREGWLPLADIARVRDAGLGTVALDIGANIGTTALPRVILGDAQLVLAAEPDPLNYACLVRNVIDNGLAGFVLPERLAISNAEGEARLANAGGLGTHYLSARSSEPDAHGVRVPTTTIDAWLARHLVAAADVGFVKCDTQGWEPQVLDGAASLLTQRHVVWQIEIHPGFLARSGTPAPQFLQRLAAQFAYFIDLRGHGRRLRPTEELLESLDYLIGRREKPFTDLLMFGTRPSA